MAVEDLYRKACDAADKGNYDYAIALYREVLRAQPDYPKARIGLRVCEKRREVERGVSIVARVLRYLKRLPSLVKGMILSSKPDKAVEAYEDFLMDNPSSVLALLKLGASARRAGLTEASVESYREASVLAPTNKNALKALAELLEETGQRDAAIKVLERLITLEPGNRNLESRYKDLQALEHMQRHNLDAATVGEGKFVEFVKDMDEAQEIEKKLQYSSGQGFEAEIKKAEASLQEDTENLTKVVRLARLYQQNEDYKKAQALLKRYMERMPDNYLMREAYGDLMLAVLDIRIRIADDKLKQNPVDIEMKQAKAEFVRKRKMIKVKEYEWRCEQHPTDHQLQLNLGHAYFDIEQSDKAIMAFQKASQDPRLSMEASTMLGQSFEKKKQYDLAIEQYTRALERNQSMNERGKDLHYKLAAVYEESGDKQKALMEYKKVYSVDISFRDVSKKVEELDVASS